MYVNLIHRPGNLAQRPMFELQQKYAHDLNLKTTVFLQYDNLFEEDLLEQVLEDQKTYGDEIGIWFANLSATSLVKKLNKKETFLWLFTEEEKRVIIEEHIQKFQSIFGYRPVSVGCYHMDSTSLRLLHEISPETKTGPHRPAAPSSFTLSRSTPRVVLAPRRADAIDNRPSRSRCRSGRCNVSSCCRPSCNIPCGW